MKAITLAACLAVLPLGAEAGAADPDSVVAGFMQAWNAADAKALSLIFEPDADFVSPFGNVAKGRTEIETFYAGAFAHGYAGSTGRGRLVSTRALTPDIVLADAEWSITGAHKPDGSPLTEEKGILVAVLRRDATGWHIAALRENEGSAAFTPLSQTR